MGVWWMVVILVALPVVGGGKAPFSALQTALQDTLYLNIFCLKDTLWGPAIPETLVTWVDVCSDSFRVEFYQTHVEWPNVGGSWRIEYYGINNDPQLRDTTLSYSFLPLGGVPPDWQQLLGINDPNTLLLLEDTVQANELHKRLILNPVQVSEGNHPGLRQKEVYLQYKNGILDLSKIRGVEEVDIYDVTGRVVARLKGGNELDLRRLPKGNYFIDIKTKWRGRFVGKLPHLGGNFNLRYGEKEKRKGKETSLENLVRVKGFESTKTTIIHPGYAIRIEPLNQNSKYMPFYNGYSIGSVLEADSLRLYVGIPINAVETLNVLMYPKELTILDENGNYYTLNFEAEPFRLWELGALLGGPLVFGNSDPTTYNQGMYQEISYVAYFRAGEWSIAERDTFVNGWIPIADSLSLGYYNPALMAALLNLTPQDTINVGDSAIVMIGRLITAAPCNASSSFQWRGDPDSANIIGNNFLEINFKDFIQCNGIARVAIISHELFGRPNGITHPNSESGQNVPPYYFTTIMAHIGHGPDHYQVLGSRYPTVIDKFALFLIQANLLYALWKSYERTTGENRIVNILANWNIYGFVENHTLFIDRFSPRLRVFLDRNNPIEDTVFADYYGRDIPVELRINSVERDSVNDPGNGYRDNIYF